MTPQPVAVPQQSPVPAPPPISTLVPTLSSIQPTPSISCVNTLPVASTNPPEESGNQLQNHLQEALKNKFRNIKR